MSFTSFNFLIIFLPVLFFLYWVFGSKETGKKLVLLIGSVVFYGSYDIKYLLFLGACILLTWFGAKFAAGKNNRSKGLIIGITASINIAILAVFKYLGFAGANINALLAHLHKEIVIPELILPVGLSFYIFQSSSYLFDVAMGKVEPEKSFVNYALFVSFFPTITSGPIQKAHSFLPQIEKGTKISYDLFRRAVFLFLWGAFLKMVIADRIAIFTDTAYANYTSYGGSVLAVAACCYSLQIYADFSGYSYMATAVAMLFGYKLSDNFTRPYLATTIPDFWRRWHISLTSWFRDYLYIPLGGNRKGAGRKYFNIFVVFLVSGLWHGASWSFVIWGIIHAFYQIIGSITLKSRVLISDKVHLDRSTWSYRLWQRICIFLLTTVAWIFFRSPTIKDSIKFIKRMITIWNPWVLVDGTLFSLGLSAVECRILAAAILLLLAISLKLEDCSDSLSDIFLRQNAPFRICSCLALFFAVLIFGIYGPEYAASSFIYAGF